MNDVESLRALWGDFPKLSIDGMQDPFGKRIEFWSATTQFVYDAALVSCGIPDVVEWQKRLGAIEDMVNRSLAKPIADTAGPRGLDVTAELQPALAFAELSERDARVDVPIKELHGSLALWLLVEGYKAIQVGDVNRARTFETQALLSVAFSFGEGLSDLTRHYSDSARVGGKASHAKPNARREALVTEFRSRAWPTKDAAAAELAEKYHFAHGTVRRWLRAERLVKA